MRQAGVIAAAGIVALQTMVTRLVEDHDNARRLASGLSSIPGITIPHEVQTNIINFETSLKISGSDFIQLMNAQGVKVGYRGVNKCRVVTHRMVTTDDIDGALNRIDIALKGFH